MFIFAFNCMDIAYMVVSGLNIEEIASAITRELPFGLWSIDMSSRTIHGYNKFCEIIGVQSDDMTFDEFEQAVRVDYRQFVRLALDELLDERKLNLIFPTNFRWVNLKLTHVDIDGKVAYGYLTECIFDSDFAPDNAHLSGLLQKQSQIVSRLISRIEGGNIENLTQSILKDVMASLGADRVSVIEYDFQTKTQTCTYEVAGYNVQPRVNMVKNLPIDIVPWLSRVVAMSEVTFVSDLKSLPTETFNLLDLLCCKNVKSMAAIPLLHEEALVGYMLIDYISKSHNVELSERNWLRTIGHVVEYSVSIVNTERTHIDEKYHFDNIINNMPFGFLHLRFLYNSQHRPHDMLIVDANRVVEKLLGVNGISGKLVSNVFGRELQHMLTVCTNVAHVGEKRIVEDFFYVNGRTICADMFMSGYNDLQCILSTDIQMLFSSNREVQSVARERLVSREMQHAIRTNLNAILGFAELLSTESDEKAKEKYMEIIKENAQSLLDSAFIKNSISGDEATAEKTSGDTSAVSAGDGQKKRILVAEDTESNYMLVSYILRNDYELIWAHDGVEALELYEKDHPDLILMDVRMPRLGGLTATSRIRETDKTTPIIALTAFAFESDKAKTLESGCSDFVSKPINAKALKDIVAKYI